MCYASDLAPKCVPFKDNPLEEDGPMHILQLACRSPRRMTPISLWNSHSNLFPLSPTEHYCALQSRRSKLDSRPLCESLGINSYVVTHRCRAWESCLAIVAIASELGSFEYGYADCEIARPCIRGCMYGKIRPFPVAGELFTTSRLGTSSVQIELSYSTPNSFSERYVH